MKIVAFGELLYRLTPPQHQRFEQADSFDLVLGGAEANTAISLAQFGNDVTYVTAVPDNPIAKHALREVAKWGVDVSHCQESEGRMGLYFLEKGASLRSGRLIYDRAYSSFSQISPTQFNWEKILQGADVFHWTGITPALSKNAAEACLEAVKTAKRMGINVCCDLNYRSKLWKYGLSPQKVMPELMEYCDLILGNENDVRDYLGIQPTASDYEEIEGFGPRAQRFISKKVIQQFPNLKHIVSTFRETIDASRNRWSSLLYDGKHWSRSETFEIHNIVDRVGGGDSYMAAFLHAFFKFKDPKMVLDFATAASALKLSIEGDFNILTEEEVLAALNRDKVGQISR